MNDLPKELQAAMEWLLEADADSEKSPAPRPNAERLETLRIARAIVADWRRGALSIDEAVRRVEALARDASGCGEG